MILRTQIHTPYKLAFRGKKPHFQPKPRATEKEKKEKKLRR